MQGVDGFGAVSLVTNSVVLLVYFTLETVILFLRNQAIPSVGAGVVVLGSCPSR